MTSLRLVAAQHAVVDEDAGELVADGAVDQRRGHGRVDAAAESAQTTPRLADPRADAAHLALDEVLHRPVGLARGRRGRGSSRRISRAARRVHDLGMELHAEAAPRRDRANAATGELALCASARQPGGSASTRSPWLIHTGVTASAVEAGEEIAVVVDRQLGRPVLAPLGARHPAAAELREDAHAVADAEHRHAELEQRRGRTAARPPRRRSPARPRG